jgi:tRNA nucleotidyltransferase (CCA-adding enzyme)
MNTLQTFLVGGAVRDHLLGFESKDRDWVVVGATPEDMLCQGFKQVGKDFPVFLHPESGDEYALARTERKSGAGYTGFETYHAADVTLEEDLQRRDLTINAMAMTPEGEIIDPYNGQRDLDRKILRHVSPAFSEDPLRVLRLARFYARFKAQGFRVADETKLLCTMIRDEGELKHLTAERVWQETHRALHEANAGGYFELLRELGCLSILFPELDALFGVPQPERYHPEIDTGIHSLMSLVQAKALSPDPEVWYATLLHDLGKGLTEKSEWPKHYGHEKTGLKPVKSMNRRLKVPRHFAELALLVCEYHTHVHKAQELKPATILKVLKQCDAFRRSKRFQQFLICCEADARGRKGLEEDSYPQRSYFLEYFEAAKQVDIQFFIRQGLKGAELGQAIDSARVAAIADNKKQQGF